MKVYITYDRYENDEWFYIYQITTKMSEVKRDYKDNLKSFIEYGHDDCHGYQIQVVNLIKDEYELLKNYVDDTIENNAVDELMAKIYDECRWCHYPDTNCLLSPDGCSDFVEMIEFWIDSHNNLGPEDYDNIEAQLQDDDKFFDKVLNSYIDKEYALC